MIRFPLASSSNSTVGVSLGPAGPPEDADGLVESGFLGSDTVEISAKFKSLLRITINKMIAPQRLVKTGVKVAQSPEKPAKADGRRP